MYYMKQRWMSFLVTGNVHELKSCALLIIMVFQQILAVNSVSTTTEGLFDDIQSLVNSVANSNLKYNINDINDLYIDDDNSTLYVAYGHNPFGPSQIYRNTTKQNTLPLHQTGMTTTKITNIYPQNLQHLDNFNTHLDNSIDPISNSNPQNNQDESRSKRNVLQLYYMINCATGCDPIMYKGYGCFCGFLGSGYPVDGIDRCCQLHDQCYTDANCIFFGEYTTKYFWQCSRGRPKCAYANLSLNDCARRLCECDVLLSRCLQRHYCPSYRKMCCASFKRLFQNIISNVIY